MAGYDSRYDNLDLFRFSNLASLAPRVFPPSDVKVILGVDRLDYTKGWSCLVFLVLLVLLAQQIIFILNLIYLNYLIHIISYPYQTAKIQRPSLSFKLRHLSISLILQGVWKIISRSFYLYRFL